MARLLVNFFYAQPVGHAIEALHYANGYKAADPELEVAVALNAATPVELAAWCPAVSTAYAIDHPFLAPAREATRALDAVPRAWTWIVDDGRRHQPLQLELFPGMRDYYAASDRHLVAERRRGYAGGAPPPYRPHQPLRLALPAAARAAAARRLGEGGPAIAVMPAGSSDRALYPSVRSWGLVLDALADAFPGVRIALVGKRAADGRTSTALGADELAELLAHRAVRSTASTSGSPSSSPPSRRATSSSRRTPASGWPRSPSARRGSRSRAAAGSSTTSTTSRSARSCPTSSAIRASASSRRPRSRRGRRDRARRA